MGRVDANPAGDLAGFAAGVGFEVGDDFFATGAPRSLSAAAATSTGRGGSFTSLAPTATLPATSLLRVVGGGPVQVR